MKDEELELDQFRPRHDDAGFGTGRDEADRRSGTRQTERALDRLESTR